MIKAGSKLAKTIIKPSVALQAQLKNTTKALSANVETLLSQKREQLNYYMNLERSASLTNTFYRSFASLPVHTKLTMPALSPTMTKGKIVQWHKKEGDEIMAGDVLADVETDKATLGFEMQDAGYVAKLLVKEGKDDVEVGQLVAILVEEKEDIKAFANFTEGQKDEGKASEKEGDAVKVTEKTDKSDKSDKKQTKSAEKEQPVKTEKKSSGSAKKLDLPAHTKLSMPALSPTMKDGKVASWNKKEGDKLIAGDVIADVETDKATVGFEMQDDGYLAKILVQAGGDSVEVGDLVAIVVEDEADLKAFQDVKVEDLVAFLKGDSGSAEASKVVEVDESSKKAASHGDQSGQKEQKESRQSTSASSGSDGSRVKASPLAKKIANEKGADLHGIQGSGPEGRILKHDVEGASTQKSGAKKTDSTAKSAAPETAQKGQTTPDGNTYTDKPLSSMRRIIAERLLESKTTIPHYYLASEVNLDNLIKVREDINKDGAVKISFNDFVIKAAAFALMEVPEVNSQWHGDHIRTFRDADISVAVDIGDGLLTPVVTGANKRGLADISSTVKDLATRAKNKQLKPQEYQGGSFCISNLGMLGIHHFAAVINLPQAAILAVGGTEKRIVPDEKNGYKTSSIMTVTLSCDHRVVDGAVGAKWLAAFKKYMEKPSNMLL